MASIHNRKLIAALAKELKAKDFQIEELKEAYLYSVVSLQVMFTLAGFISERMAEIGTSIGVKIMR